MFIQAWRKNQKVEMTSPGSKNPYKVTYWDGQEKWTDDYPGDGRGGRRDEMLRRRKHTRPSVKDAKATLHTAVGKYVKGEVEIKALSDAVDNVIVHVGREMAREVIRDYLKVHKDESEGKTKEAHEAIRERMLDKLRRKKAMSTRMVMIAGKVMASEVTRILAGQLRMSMSYLIRAATQASGRRVYKTSIDEIGPQSVRFTIVLEDDLSLGGIIHYDYGPDTYTMIPFGVQSKKLINGREIDDFYAEDFQDTSKMKYIFQDVLKKFVGFRASEEDRIATDDREISASRLERVHAVLDKIKRISGVEGVVINDYTRTADSVEIFIGLKARERFQSGLSPFYNRVKEFDVDLKRIRWAVMAALKADGDMGIQSLTMPKRLYKTETFNYKRETIFVGYDDDMIRADLWVR